MERSLAELIVRIDEAGGVTRARTDRIVVRDEKGEIVNQWRQVVEITEEEFTKLVGKTLGAALAKLEAVTTEKTQLAREKKALAKERDDLHAVVQDRIAAVEAATAQHEREVVKKDAELAKQQKAHERELFVVMAAAKRG